LGVVRFGVFIFGLLDERPSPNRAGSRVRAKELRELVTNASILPVLSALHSEDPARAQNELVGFVLELTRLPVSYGLAVF
jgi:hypothetical protein